MRAFSTILLFCLSFFCNAQHELKANFTPAEDFTYAFLYRMTPKDPVFIENSKIDSLGQTRIELDSIAIPGIYKVIYALPPEENNFDFIYNGKEDIELTFDMENGVQFISSNENKLWASYLKSMDIINRTISNYYTQESTDTKAFADIFKTLKDTQIAYENSSKDMLVNTFIKANRPYIPKGYEDLKTYSNNLKTNYFKVVDFENPLLQSSTFISDRINGFVFGFMEDPDYESYLSQIEIIANAVNLYSDKTQRDLFEMLWKRFTSLEDDKMANTITDFYLLKIAERMNDTDLIDRIISYKNTSKGKTAPNFDIVTPEGMSTSLLDLEYSKRYLLVFWSSTCSHCLKELPQIKELLKNNTDYKVVAFGIEYEDYTWKKAINEFPNFTHTIGLGKWDNPVVDTYGISATPTYFVLDSDKTIIAKPYDLEALKVILEKK